LESWSLRSSTIAGHCSTWLWVAADNLRLLEQIGAAAELSTVVGIAQGTSHALQDPERV
jgi:hypothetical protein